MKFDNLIRQDLEFTLWNKELALLQKHETATIKSSPASLVKDMKYEDPSQHLRWKP